MTPSAKVTALLMGFGFCLARPAAAADLGARGNENQSSDSDANSSATRADDSDSDGDLQLHFDGGFGATSQGLDLGGTGLLRWQVLEVGSGCGASGFFSSRTGCGALAGLAFKSDHWQLDALAEGGVNYIHAAGGLFSDDPGASGTIGYVGGRLGTRYLFGSGGRWRADLGLWLFVQSDLSGYQARYGYTERSWLSDQTYQQSGSKLIGNQSEIGLRFVGGFDYFAD